MPLITILLTCLLFFASRAEAGMYLRPMSDAELGQAVEIVSKYVPAIGHMLYTDFGDGKMSYTWVDQHGDTNNLAGWSYTYQWPGTYRVIVSARDKDSVLLGSDTGYVTVRYARNTTAFIGGVWRVFRRLDSLNNVHPADSMILVFFENGRYDFTGPYQGLGAFDDGVYRSGGYEGSYRVITPDRMEIVEHAEGSDTLRLILYPQKFEFRRVRSDVRFSTTPAPLRVTRSGQHRFAIHAGVGSSFASRVIRVCDTRGRDVTSLVSVERADDLEWIDLGALPLGAYLILTSDGSRATTIKVIR